MRGRFKRKAHLGFTLVEILIVISIFSLIIYRAGVGAWRERKL